MHLQCDYLSRFATLQQDKAHQDTSSKYAFIPTSRALSVLADNGWTPTKVQEAGTRKAENRGYQKHLLRLRHSSMPFVPGHTPEIVLINSHMGSSSFQLMLGIYRIVCTNGLIAGSTVEKYAVRHVGFAESEVENALKNLLRYVPTIGKQIERAQSITLDRHEQKALAKAAIELKYDVTDDSYRLNADGVPVDLDQALKTRRYEDQTPSLWNTYNVLQENLIKGRHVVTTQTSRWGRRAREVKSVDQTVSLNRALHTLMSEMAKLKGSTLAA